MMAEKWIPVIVELVTQDGVSYGNVYFHRISKVENMHVVACESGEFRVKLHMAETDAERDARASGYGGTHVLADLRTCRPMLFSSPMDAFARVVAMTEMFPRSWPAETVKFGDLNTRTTG